MKVVFLLPGTEGRPKCINGDTIRSSGASSSGTDQSVIIVAEYLAKRGHDVTIVLDKTDKLPCRGVKYTDFTYEGLHNIDVDVLISTLWFTDYKNLPFDVKKGLIYWYHMAWVYGIREIIDYCTEKNIQLAFVNPSKWAQLQNIESIEEGSKHIKNVVSEVIPNPIMVDLIQEIKKEKEIIRKPKSSIFHAQHSRGGGVADKAIEKLNWEKSYRFDYTDPQNGVDKKTVFEKLLESDYFIFPLYHPNGCVYKDTFSCSVAEAIAAGVIVITYPLGAFPEYFSEGCSFLEFPASTKLEKMLTEKVTCDAQYMNVYQNIVERLTYLEANPHLKDEIREKSKDLIQNNFSIKQIGERWINLINSFDVQPCNVRDYVSHAVYINLNSREDRKKQFEEELRKNKLNGVERLEGIQLTQEEHENITNRGGWIHPPSELYQDRIDRLNSILIYQRSCTESHKKAVQLAKDNNWDNLLIFEDDCIFTQNVKRVLEDLKVFIETNNDWDLIFLGVNLKHVPEKYNDTFYKLTGRFYTTHAYVINKKFYDTLLSYDHTTCCNIDVFYTDLAISQNYYCYHKLAAIQRKSFSNIELLDMSYSGEMLNSFYINTKKHKNSLDLSKIGFFYQTSKNPCALFMNLQQIKTYYSTSPIVIWEDISDYGKTICKHFNIKEYKKVHRLPSNTEWNRSRPIMNINDGLHYLHRLYTSCVNELSSAEWIMHYEDDVWCAGYIKNLPETEWGGTLKTAWSSELQDYIRNEMQLTGDLFHGACGGALINKDAIINSYHKLQQIDWAEVLKRDKRIELYSDFMISFMLLAAGYQWSKWEDWEQGGHFDYKIHDKPIIHNIKYWYYHPRNLHPKDSLEELNLKEPLHSFIKNNQFVNV
jgi:GR25 family glycosyltransferase involved in LPS biosynthesis/glycosyltransferase involved in cell wall biosynthesis